MRPGETVTTSVLRLLKNEVSLNVDEKFNLPRIRTICTHSYVWGMRKQLPEENGTSDLVCMMSVELTKEEAESIKELDKNEYSSHRWVHPQNVVLGKWDDETPQDFHPALKKGCLNLLAMWKWDELNILLQKRESVGDKEIVDK
eukprot:TRINITY_DN1933_c0_g1_i2.p1 TRINITY_DN1933_c0_g1~~TRINITY_DN1933_c0_g1_i2.p1  ORF type:complete len:144 (-),score=16.50 TRINITY_DN1933_c0_g1_i2:122-553(-)